MSDRPSSTFIGDNTYGSTLNQGSIITGDGSHVGNINHFHNGAQQASALKSCLKDLLAALKDDPDDHRQALEDRKGPRTEGTCEWVSRSVAYKSWATKSSGLLWISGDAGKGKTMLALNLVSTLKNQSSAGHVVHFFCSRDHGRNNGASILRGIIYQLLEQKPQLFEHVSDDYEKHGASLFDDRKFQALWAIFARITQDQNVTSITCILDGLDECDEDGLEYFWTKIQNLYESNPGAKSDIHHHCMRLLIVSRNHPHSIQRALEDYPRLQFECENEYRVKSDVFRFIDDRMAGLKCPGETRAHVKEKLYDRAEGTYLWAGFAINALKKVRAIDMERTVESFPRGLDAMYRRMLLAIDEHERDRVMEILRWITTTFQPLSLVELATAVQTQPASGQMLADAITDEIGYAGDLLTIVQYDRHSRKVLLVHSSVLDFFRNIAHHDQDLGPFHLQAAITNDHVARCLLNYTDKVLQTIGSVQDYAPYFDGGYGMSETVTQKHPLLKYATYNAFKHLSQSESFHRIKDHHPLLDPAYQYHTPWLRLQCRARSGHEPKDGVKLAYVAVLFGLLEVLETDYCQLKANVDIRDGDQRTSLFYAALASETGVVEWLLDHGADPNAQDVTGQTPLHIAAQRGVVNIVQMLLRHGAKTRTQSSTRTAKSMLHGSTYNEDGDPLGEDDDLCVTMPKWSGTPVHIAAIAAEPQVLKILLRQFLRKGGSINVTDENGRTIFHQIAGVQTRDLRSCWDVLRRYSKPPNTFNQDSLDNNGESALHIATRKCCPGLGWNFQDDFAEDPESENTIWSPVIALIETLGATVDIRTTTGLTPLHLACKRGILSLVDYLLAQGADARLYDQSGQSALHWLCSQEQQGRERRPEILERLVRRMTLEDMEAKRADGQSARDVAVKPDADYLERKRRYENGLTPNIKMPAEPKPKIVAKFFLSSWQLNGRCLAFEELHNAIDLMIALVKMEASDEDEAQMQRDANELPHMQHWVDKRRLYRKSKAKE
ncbi:uncharacterized protein J4E92_011003 [Alternaria infectoria]|uniref:uncharacterized protein n=1 Tax=Alternaria infectoria TaxID=45303 RepID=UPI00221F0C41|nr:uncharacterized protein J4E92_011003 [Alternaria infectoria]KAI4907999.1 hypothetical protein J4E92_011003 [Alternaria infectoria]